MGRQVAPPARQDRRSVDVGKRAMLAGKVHRLAARRGRQFRQESLALLARIIETEARDKSISLRERHEHPFPDGKRRQLAHPFIVDWQVEHELSELGESIRASPTPGIHWVIVRYLSPPVSLRGYLKTGMRTASPAEQEVRNGERAGGAGSVADDLAGAG